MASGKDDVHFFSGLPRQSSHSSEATATDGTRLNLQIQQLRSAFSDTQKKTKQQVGKFKELVDFNRQLMNSYLTNLHVIIQVSQLLQEVQSFISVVKGSLDVMDNDLSTQLDMNYLQKLTKDNIYAMYDNFNKEVEGMKNVYISFDKVEDAKQLENAQMMMKKAVNSASSYVNTINTDKQHTGGKKQLKPKPLNKKILK